MTNAELESELKRASTDERLLTKRIVELVAEALRRKIWAGRGYASAHRWLVGEFGYSDSSAGRRLDAARLLADVPDVAEKLATGELTLSGLSQLQSAIHQEEKRTGEKVTAEAKRNVVKKIEGKTSPESSRTVSAEFPEVSKAPRESLRPAGADGWTLTVGGRGRRRPRRCRRASPRRRIVRPTAQRRCRARCVTRSSRGPAEPASSPTR